MPKFTGIKCEECHRTKVEGEPQDAGSTDEWREMLVRMDSVKGPAMAIYLGPGIDPGQNPGTEMHYLCSSPCFFSHIAKLLKIDPTTLHR